MKPSKTFKEVILKYLQDKSKEDELFAEFFEKEEKNIDDCITYILNTVKSSGCNGFTDDEVFCMAVHYYYEEGIVVGDKCNAKVVVNHHIELTEEEIKAARQKAIDDRISEEKSKLEKKITVASTKPIATTEQPTLF